MYADYAFYTTQYGGKAVLEDDWPGLSNRATAYIDMVTGGAAKNTTGDALNAVRMASCALAEIFQDEARVTASAFSAGGSVQSETVGGWSRTYGSKTYSAAEMSVFDNRKQEALLLWLGNTGLLKVREIPRCQCSRTR